MSQLISIRIDADSITQIDLPTDILYITHATVLPPVDSKLHYDSNNDNDEVDFDDDDIDNHDSITDASYLIQCTTSSTSNTNNIILGRVDLEQTQLSLDIKLNNINGKNIQFTLINENKDNNEKWAVMLTGYILLNNNSKQLFNLNVKQLPNINTTSQNNTKQQSSKSTTQQQQQNNNNKKRKQSQNEIPGDDNNDDDDDVIDDDVIDSIDNGVEAEDSSMSDNSVHDVVENIVQKKQDQQQQQANKTPVQQKQIQKHNEQQTKSANKQQQSTVNGTSSQQQQQSNKKQKAESSNIKPQVVKLKGGLQYVTKRQGDINDNNVVRNGSNVSIRYRGTLLNGREFDSNLPRGQPLKFKIGAQEVITGMEQGMIGMKMNEIRMIHIPSQLGYGKQGAGSDIPPNSDLVFEVHLLKTK